MHVPINWDLPSPFSRLWSYTKRKKDIYILKNCLSKNIMYVAPFAGRYRTVDVNLNMPSCIPARQPLTAATSGPLNYDAIGRWRPDIYFADWVVLFSAAIVNWQSPFLSTFYTPVEDGSYYVVPSVRPDVCLSICPSVNFSCPLHKSVTVQDIFMKLGKNINHHQTMCREQEPTLHLHFYRIMGL